MRPSSLRKLRKKQGWVDKIKTPTVTIGNFEIPIAVSASAAEGVIRVVPSTITYTYGTDTTVSYDTTGDSYTYSTYYYGS